MQLQLYSQSELLTLVKTATRTTGTAPRWYDNEVYLTMTLALQMMMKYRTPVVYTPSGLDSAYSLDLPAGIEDVEKIDFQSEGGNQWVPLYGWSVVVGNADGLTVEFPISPVTGTVRVHWSVPAPSFPTDTLTLAANITSTDTSLVTDRPPGFTPERAGWLLIGNEWMFYKDVVIGANDLTFSSIDRAEYGSTAVIHNLNDTVELGLAVHDPGQLGLFVARTLEQLHVMTMHLSADVEQDHHAIAARYWQDQGNRLEKALPHSPVSLHLAPSALQRRTIW